MSGTAAIDAQALVRRYGELVAVDGVDLRVEAGESFALLGPNGAGKSTTIGMLTTLLRPDAGSARVAGADVLADPHAVRSRIGIVFQDPTLDPHLTVGENLRFHAAMYDVPRRDVNARVEALLERFGLGERSGALVRTLSGGLRRRVELARALLHEPQVLFLDEPTLGLDPRARATFAEELRSIRAERGTTTLLTTHYLAEAEHCDRVAIIDGGRIVACDTPAALRAAQGPDATLDDVYLALTGRDLRPGEDGEAPLGRRDQGRLQDRQRSGRG